MSSAWRTYSFLPIIFFSLFIWADFAFAQTIEAIPVEGSNLTFTTTANYSNNGFFVVFSSSIARIDRNRDINTSIIASLVSGNHYYVTVPVPTGLSCENLGLYPVQQFSTGSFGAVGSISTGTTSGPNCNFDFVATFTHDLNALIFYDYSGSNAIFSMQGTYDSARGTWDYWSGDFISHGAPTFTFSEVPPVVGPEPCSTNCFSNVLFLPGFEGSRLYMTRVSGTEDQLWEPNWDSDVRDLLLNTDGTSINPNIYTKDIIKETNTPVEAGSLGLNIYKSFSERMDSMVSGGLINDWQAFAYDWRQSTEDIVNNPQKYDGNQEIPLTSVLQSLVNNSKNGKVTIIGHSNGGILAKTLLLKLQADKSAGRNDLIDHVDVLIMVASPEIGTASAIPAILHGYNQAKVGGLFMSQLSARELGRNSLGAYALLPSREYLSRVSGETVKFENTLALTNLMDPYLNFYGPSVDSYAEYKNFLLGGEGRIQPFPAEFNLPIKLSPDLFTKAESLHDKVDAWTPPEGMRVIEVAGWGVNTIAGFKYKPKVFSCYSQDISCSHYVLDEEPIFTINGDKTVIEQSAHYMSLSGKAEKYWLNLHYFNNGDKTDGKKETYRHSNIFEVSPIVDFISDTLQKVPYSDSAYISTTMPVYSGDLVRVSIHSPVSIDAYDSAGNHTGKVCPESTDLCYADESIPNSSYLEFGEGKYINLPEEGLKNIKLFGTGVGTFTYNSELVHGDGTSNVSSFVDIPVTEQTLAEVTLDANKAPELKLDVTGDGLYDFTLAPNAEFDPITYLQIMKATISSLDLGKAQKRAFIERVDSIIKAIQKGKISKAKLKADKFKATLERRVTKPDLKPNRHDRGSKPKKLSKEDAQALLDMLNKLLDNLN